jgi:hypothetical protein
MHSVMRSVFAEQFLDDIAYDSAFDRTEVILGLLSQDQECVRASQDPTRTWIGDSAWFGRSTWRAAKRLGNPVEEIKKEKDLQGGTWGALQAGLFGGDPDRVDQAITEYSKSFVKGHWSH